MQSHSPERRPELRSRAWLMTIGANVWRNHVRTSVRRPVSVMQVEDTQDSWSNLTVTEFEQLHHSRTGRSALPATAVSTGLRTAVRRYAPAGSDNYPSITTS